MMVWMDEEHDDVDDEGFNNFLSGYGISSEKEEETEQDLSKLRQSDIQELVDDALDRGDYAEVARVSKYLKEGQEIYIKELERINESFIRRQKNK
jgi:ferritin